MAGTRRFAYEYNAFGQLVRRRLNGTIDRHFAWDQGHLLIELNGALTNRVSEYAYYPGTDEPMVVLHGLTAVTARRYVYQDAQGSVIGLVGTNGTVARWQHDGDPWAALLGAWAGGTLPTDTLRLRWQGLFYEADSTKLYYARARWYDPLTKRFLSPDPIGLAGGVHPYLFAGGDPMNARDPSGMLVSDHRGVCSLFAASCGASQGAAYFAGLAGIPDEAGGGGGGSFLRGLVEVSTPTTIPSCRSVDFAGSHGTISVQTHPNGTVAWGIYMNDPTANYGPWVVDVYVGSRRVDSKSQGYAPHGSVSPRDAPRGALFRVEATHTDTFNRRYSSASNVCIIP